MTGRGRNTIRSRGLVEGGRRLARKEVVSPPEEGSTAPEFNLPGAQGGQLRLGLRTARGPVIVVFYRGAWSEECAEYFRALAEKEREINVAGATLVGIGPAEPEEAREFVRETGFKSYLLYDYVRVATRDYGLFQRDPEHGDSARPAAFLVGTDHDVLRAWLDERPAPDELLAEVSRVTGLPKEPEEGEEEKPKKRPRRSAGSEADSAAGSAAESTTESEAGSTASTEAPESAGGETGKGAAGAGSASKAEDAENSGNAKGPRRPSRKADGEEGAEDTTEDAGRGSPDPDKEG